MFLDHVVSNKSVIESAKITHLLFCSVISHGVQETPVVPDLVAYVVVMPPGVSVKVDSFRMAPCSSWYAVHFSPLQENKQTKKQFTVY